jgi:predicted nucleotide-binding protein
MSAISKLEDLIESGWKAPDIGQYMRWNKRVEAFLARALSETAASHFRDGWTSNMHDWEAARYTQIGTLEGLQAQVLEDAELAAVRPGSPKSVPVHPKRIFIVHGHDTAAKETVARFVERIGLEPIILHEQPNAGLTIIEKFEAHSRVGFAVVLLTPDDFGGSATSPTDRNGRARQNVILELGYFIGKLSRGRVCALFKSGVEMPSDFQGVIYIELDSAGAWRTKLAQELVEAGFSPNLEALLKS